MAENNHDTDISPNNEASDRPVVELFVKAAVDKMKNGPCPMCHRYFLVFYLLRERGLIDLVVTTFLPQDPPKEVLAFSSGKRFPLVKVHKGIDAGGQDMTNIQCDTIDEIEALIQRFECDDMPSRLESRVEEAAEKAFEDLFGKFNQFMKYSSDDPSKVLKYLEKINSHLKDRGSKFMVSDRLSRADCYLLPTLQHIRVAGKAYKDFEIPTEFTHLWRYLSDAYQTDAFRESCPADREIISHYIDKASVPSNIMQKKASLMKEERTFSVPDGILNGTDN